MKFALITAICSFSIIAQAQSRAWFAYRNPIVNCESFASDGKSINRRVEVRGKVVTFQDLESNETLTFTGQIRQESSHKVWKSEKQRLSVSLRPSSWGQALGSIYHSGVLEIKVDAQKYRDFSFYCFPQIPQEDLN